MQEKSLRQRLIIIISTIFVLPSLVLSYIFYEQRVTLSLSNVALFFFIMVLAIIGIILVRYVFDAISITANFLKKATEGGEKLSLNLHQEAVELNEISSSFNRLIERFENTTESLNQAKEALHASEEKYRNILEHIAEGYYEVDLGGNLTFFNTSISKILGYSVEELKGMNNRQYMNKENSEKVFLDYNEVYRTGVQKNNLDMELIRKDGKKMYVGTSISLIRDSLGQPIGFRGIVYDITERKRAEEALCESEAKLQAIVNTVGTGIIIIDSDTQVIIEANQTAIEMTGLPKERIIGQICHSLVCPAQAGKCPVKDLGQSVDNSERKLLCSDGYLKDILKTVYPITIKGRDCYLESFIDITERKRTEEALRESEKRYRALVESASEIIFRTDETGNFTFVNPAGFRITGYTEEDVIGKPYLAFIRSDMRDKAMKLFGRQFVKGIQNTYLEYPLLTKAGHELWLGQNTQLIYKDGKVVAFQAEARDITERRLIEEELKKREAMLNEMGRIAKVGGWEFDAVSKRQVWTKEVYRILEVDESYEPTVSRGIEFYIPESRLTIERAVQRAIEYGEPFDVELEITTAKGNHRWIHANGNVQQENGITKTVYGTFQDITERRQAQEKIRQMAYHDSLTGLPNRKLFTDRLGIALAQAQRNQKKAGIAMLDLDKFKIANDTLGHDVGDLLLKAAAGRLSAALRKGDTVARFGGDEFVLILPDLKGIEDANQVAQKIVENFRKPFLIDTHQLIVTTSIGVAVYPHDGTDEAILLKNADIAMYRAKQTGRDRYQLYNEA